MKKLIVWLVVLGALGGGGWWAWKKYPEQVRKLAFWEADASKDGKKKPGRPTSAVVSPRDINFAVTAAGEIGPLDVVSVRPEVSGRIKELPVDIGDRVKKGDLLFALDDTDLQIERSSRLIEIAGSKLQIEGARLNTEKAKMNFDRTKQLFENTLVSQEVFDNMRNDYDVTRNNVEIMKNRLEGAEKSLALLEDKLSKTRILAPFDCTILTRPVAVGQAVSGSGGVNAGTEVLTIANLSEMLISAHINQSDVTRLRVGQAVQVDVEAVSGLKLTGTVDRIAPQATIKNGIKGFATRIILRNPDPQVRPGMTGNLTIPLISADNVLAVPLAAVFTDQGDRFVFVKKGESFVRQQILVGVADYDFAEIVKGLDGGETVSLIQPAGETATQAFADKKGEKKGKGGGKGGGKTRQGSGRPSGSGEGGGGGTRSPGSGQ